MSGVKHCLGAAIAIGAALGLASPASADSLKLHVNQVALERTGSKTAIVEYEGLAEAGGFTLLRDGKPVATGALERLPEFTEWGVGKRYFAADFSHVREPGAYAIEVSIGKTSARSPAFVLADGALFGVTGPALVDYFRLSRHTDAADRNITPTWQTPLHIEPLAPLAPTVLEISICKFDRAALHWACQSAVDLWPSTAPRGIRSDRMEGHDIMPVLP